MRRADREIADPAVVSALLARAHVLYLAMCDDGMPYVVPLSYGYDGERTLFLHSAPAGRKVEVLRRHPHVGFAVTVDAELVMGETSCACTFKFRSVVGEGIVFFVEDEVEKRRGLDVLMRQHGGTGGDYAPAALAKTAVLRLEITSLSGKQVGY